MVLAEGLANVKPTTMTFELRHAAPAVVTVGGQATATTTTSIAVPTLAGLGGVGGPTAMAMANEAAWSGENKSTTSTPTGRAGRTLADENGVTIKSYGTNDAHKPAHAHVTGGGREVRIGPNGKPLKGQPELTPKQAKS